MRHGSSGHRGRLRTGSLVIILALISFLKLPVFAQNELPDEAKKELERLPPSAQALIPKLFALDWLPQPQWKIHLANLPHGEAVKLDESDWEVVKIPSRGPTDAVWYRAWIEVPTTADQGRHHFSYSLYPHAGGWKEALTVRHGYEFNYKLEGFQVPPHAGVLGAEHSYMSVDANNLVLTAMKKTEDGDGLVLRFYEWAGETGEARVDVPAGATSARKANLMEEVSGSDLPLKSGSLTVPYHPFEILSVRLSYTAGPTRGE